MNVVFKYPVTVDDGFEIELPEGAVCLTVQAQGTEPQLWALVDPAQPKRRRSFRLVGTGHPFDSVGLEYVGTFQLRGGALVFHLFERPS